MSLEEFKALGFKMDKFIQFPTPRFLFEYRAYCVASYCQNKKSIRIISDINSNSYYYGFYLDKSSDFRIVQLDKKYFNRIEKIRKNFSEYYKQNI